MHGSVSLPTLQACLLLFYLGGLFYPLLPLLPLIKACILVAAAAGAGRRPRARRRFSPTLKTVGQSEPPTAPCRKQAQPYRPLPPPAAGLWGCDTPNGNNSGLLPLAFDFVTAMVKGGTKSFAIKGGNAGSNGGGALSTMWDGPRPPGYTPMRKTGGACKTAL